ncbi:MAG: sulfatase-like hydrolase/transferase, partial [Gemmatimonadetes bacterium]|nr:sulfatase-like hydrolase/transferase [Gemmatimonadota bacterium]
GIYWLPRYLVLAVRWLGGRRDQLGRKSAADVNSAFLRWLDGNDGRPFFAFLNYFDAHHPYETRAPFDRRFSDRPPRYWLYVGQNRRYPDSEIVELRDAYDATLAYLDDRLGHLLAELDRRGTLRNTVVIVTSDHGEQFGEHGLMNHGNSLYMPVLHVPLVIVFPDRVPAGLRIAQTVSLRDIPATVIDLAGIRDSLPGQSLALTWNDVTMSIEPALASAASNEWSAPWDPVRRGPMKSMTTNRMHYIANGDGIEELYDVSLDPLEEHNLVNTAAAQRLLVQFRSRLGSVTRAMQPNPPLARQ